MNKILISMILITSTGYSFELEDLPVSTMRKPMDRYEMFQEKKIYKGRLGMQEKPGRLGYNTESSGANHGQYPVDGKKKIENSIPEAKDNRTRTNLQPRFVPIEKGKYYFSKKEILWAIAEVESGNKDIGLHPDKISYGRYGITKLAATELWRYGKITDLNSYKTVEGNKFAANEYLMLMARRHNVQNWLLAAGYYHSSTPDLREAYMLRIRKALAGRKNC